MKAVEGNAKFIGLRHELPLASVSPFLRTRLTPEYQNGEAGLDELAAQILDISRKPPLGETPRYAQSHLQGSTWAGSARAVAEYFVRTSEHAHSMDPQASYSEIQVETGKSEEHTSELQSLMRISYAVFCLKKKKKQK